jgi:hypothetical protein
MEEDYIVSHESQIGDTIRYDTIQGCDDGMDLFLRCKATEYYIISPILTLQWQLMQVSTYKLINLCRILHKLTKMTPFRVKNRYVSYYRSPSHQSLSTVVNIQYLYDELPLYSTKIL